MTPDASISAPSRQDPTDKQLLSGCLSGRCRDQELFIRRFSNLVYATIQSVSRTNSSFVNTDEFDDLHNTVFMLLFDKSCRKLRQYKGKNGCSLASWVRVVTVRCVLDHLRRTKDAMAKPDRLVSFEAFQELPNSGPTIWQLVEQKEQMKILETAMHDLPDRDQLFLRYHLFEGRSLDGIAGLLNISSANIHSVKHRAVKRLKEAVALRMNEKN